MVIDLQSRPIPASRVRLQIDPVDGDPILLYPEGLLKLNPTAHDIVSRCDGRTTVESIIAALGAEYEVSPDTLRDDVLQCLSHLQGRQLMTVAV